MNHPTYISQDTGVWVGSSTQNCEHQDSSKKEFKQLLEARFVNYSVSEIPALGNGNFDTVWISNGAFVTLASNSAGCVRGVELSKSFDAYANTTAFTTVMLVASSTIKDSKKAKKVAEEVLSEKYSIDLFKEYMRANYQNEISDSDASVLLTRFGGIQANDKSFIPTPMWQKLTNKHFENLKSAVGRKPSNK